MGGEDQFIQGHRAQRCLCCWPRYLVTLRRCFILTPSQSEHSGQRRSRRLSVQSPGDKTQKGCDHGKRIASGSAQGKLKIRANSRCRQGAGPQFQSQVHPRRLLTALAFAAQRTEAAALAALPEAVERATAGGALRLLVDCGASLIGLLLPLTARAWLLATSKRCWRPWQRQLLLWLFLSPVRRCIARSQARGSSAVDQPLDRHLVTAGETAPRQRNRPTVSVVAADGQEAHAAHLPQAKRSRPPRGRGSGSSSRLDLSASLALLLPNFCFWGSIHWDVFGIE